MGRADCEACICADEPAYGSVTRIHGVKIVFIGLLFRHHCIFKTYFFIGLVPLQDTFGYRLAIFLWNVFIEPIGDGF